MFHNSMPQVMLVDQLNSEQLKNIVIPNATFKNSNTENSVETPLMNGYHSFN